MHMICKTSFPFQAYQEMEMSGPSHPHEVNYSTCEMGYTSLYFVAVVLNQLLRKELFNLQNFKKLIVFKHSSLFFKHK